MSKRKNYQKRIIPTCLDDLRKQGYQDLVVEEQAHDRNDNQQPLMEKDQKTS